MIVGGNDYEVKKNCIVIFPKVFYGSILFSDLRKLEVIMMANVRFNAEIQDRLAYLAKETGRTISYYIREAVESKIEDLEDIYLAEKALEDLKAGRSSVVSWESIKKGNNL